jgi:beta-lactam-binding protein with PASTA domain
MLLAITLVALAALGAAIAYFLTHRDERSSVTTVVRSSGTGQTAVTTMPKLTGKKLDAAQTELAAFGIRASVTPETSSRPAGTVLAQAPIVGAKLTRGTDVTLVVARPTHAETSSTTSTAPTTTTTSASSTTTTPQTTTAAAPAPPQNATMPDVTNGTEAAAVQSLNRAGILASLAFVPSSDPLGTVEAQAKAAGTTLPYHSHVQINVSSGPGDKPQQQVPNVIGRSLKAALASINGAQLRLLYVRFPVTSHSQAGTVVQQSPLAGAHAPRNAQIVVFLGSFSG